MKVKTKSNKTSASIKNGGTLQLPGDYPWKVLDWLSSDLAVFLTKDDLELIRSIIRRRDIGAYYHLAESWGLQSTSSSTTGTYIEKQCRYQLTALLKKYLFDTDAAARKGRALEKFYQYETVCKEFNQDGYKSLDVEHTYMAVIFRHMQKYVSSVLRPKYLVGSGDLLKWSRHGPGSTLGTKAGLVGSFHKYSEWPYSVTSDCLAYAQFLVQSDQRWLGALYDDYRERNNIPQNFPIDNREFLKSLFEIVPGNKVTTVPKDGQIDRTIAIEPTMNLMLQLGLDGYIRHRLKNYSIDLDHDQARNQELARLGSFNSSEPFENFCTLDLSGASDTVSLKLCEKLFEPDWYDYFLRLRSPCGIIEGESVTYEKVSSMGNGFTFALETLVFASIIFGVYKYLGIPMKNKFSVYGDDIIIVKEADWLIRRVLSKCGFKINAEKSFSQGYVRESCGADWFRGRLIRPVFLKAQPQNVKELFSDINRINRFLLSRVEIEGSCCSHMKKWVPKSFLGIQGPVCDEEFDTYLHAPFPTVKYNSRTGFYQFRKIVSIPITLKGNKFLFRKLMATLRPKDQTTSANGSCFDVVRRNLNRVSVVPASCSYWQDAYTPNAPDLKNL